MSDIHNLLVDIATADFLLSGITAGYFIRYPWIITPDRLTKEIGYTFRHSSKDVIRLLLKDAAKLKNDDYAQISPGSATCAQLGTADAL